MAKRIPIVLSQSVSKLGNNGDLVEVAPGQVEQRREKERQQKLAEKQAAENQKTALKTIGRLTIRKQVGEADAIFGTVTTQEVADVIKEQAGLEVDRRGIELPDISTTGDYQAEVKLKLLQLWIFKLFLFNQSLETKKAVFDSKQATRN